MVNLEKISLFFAGKDFKIDEVIVDAILSESFTLSSKISEHPVESGETIVDHVCNLPTVITIEGIISNTPMTPVILTAFKSLNNFMSDKNNDLSQLAFSKIEEIFIARKPITISTSLKDYENMVLESFNVERGGGFFDSLHFNCTAKQIIIANQETIEIPRPKEKNTMPKKNAGKQETKKASAEIELKISSSKKMSLLKKLFNG